MIEIRLFYFGWISDITQCKEEKRILSKMTINEILDELCLHYPKLNEREKYRISVNRKLITENVTLSQGDEIALLPPFSGG
jgi:molybdopterin converting factor small subunit